MSTDKNTRLHTDANIFIDQAIKMLKDLPELQKSPYTAGYNGVVCLLQYAKESHAHSLLRDPVDSVPEDPEFVQCGKCDGHAACEDFGCAFVLGLGRMVNTENNL